MLFVVVMVRAIKVASGRGNARRETGGESAMLSMALQDALDKLKQQERAMAARAEASERLADQIVEGLTSGWSSSIARGMVQAINPAARRFSGSAKGRGIAVSRGPEARHRAVRSDRRSARRHLADRAPHRHARRRAAAAPRRHGVADCGGEARCRPRSACSPI